MKKQYIIPLAVVENMDMTDIIAASLPFDAEGSIQLGTDDVLVRDDSIWESLEMDNML